MKNVLNRYLPAIVALLTFPSAFTDSQSTPLFKRQKA